VAPERRGYEGEASGYDGEGGRPVRAEGTGGAGAPGREPVAGETGRERLGAPVRREGEPATAPVARERTLGWRSRNAGAAAVGAVGGGVLLLGRLVMTVAALIALLIALAIVLRDVGANSSNAIVEGIHEGANFFAGSFTGLLTFGGKPKLELTVDWGIALIAYLIVGAVIAGAIRSIGLGGLRFEQRHRPAL